MIIESAEAYRARPAVCASFLIDHRNTCPAYAWAFSELNPERLTKPTTKQQQRGIDVHLAGLEPDEFARRVTIVDAPNWLGKQAKADRAVARSQGRTPLLPKELERIEAIRTALMNSKVGLWLSQGLNERTVTWEWEGGLTCKIRPDCVTRFDGGPLLDLKSAISADPEAFQRNILTLGHDIRAAFYRDGWMAAEGERRAYLFVLVSVEPPHLVTVRPLSERAEEWGRRCYRRALHEIDQSLKTGLWSDYDGAAVVGEPVDLPTWAEYRLAEAFAEEDAP